MKMGKNKKNDWKNRDGVVYSTGDDYDYDYQSGGETKTLLNGEQQLRVQLDKKARGGKRVTLVTGFTGTDEDLRTLGKLLKTKCGVGGSAKDGEIIIQGDLRDKVMEILNKAGYQARKI
jgi:translation initiation factor 1